MNFQIGRRKGMSLSDRIERMTTYVPFTGCKLYLGHLSDGYGRIDVERKMHTVHRVVWELTHGKIPEGKVIAHSCDVRSCCNVNHLFLASQSENMIDAIKKNRGPSQKLFTDDVKYIRTSNESHEKLSLKFGVSTRQIRKIRQNRLHFTFL